MKLVKEQRDFFQSQRTKDISFRVKALKRLQREIMSREDDICEALFSDFKKPKFESLGAETQFVLAELKYAIKKMAFWAKPERVSSSLMNWPSTDHIYKEPYGTVLIIAPWNYPFQLAMAPLIGAIAAGNTAVIKPSEVTPHTSNLLAEIIQKVFDPKYVTVVEGDAETSQKLLAEKWDYIFFTGSTRVGQIVYESAAKQLTPVTLELGGKNPCIVDHTAAIKTAAKRIAWGKFLNAGQTCIATDYVLVHAKVKDQLIDALQKCIVDFFGQDVEKSSDYARIVNENHYSRLKSLLESEDIAFGGHTNDADRYLSPTLVNEPQSDGDLMEDEIFGPILPIISYQNEAELDKYMVNYGKPLATYIFSNRKSFQRKMLKAHSFGGGAINDTVIQITNKRLPFGGVGSSGIGAYHGRTSFDLFSHHKSMIKKANWPDIPLRYPPYNLPLKFVKKIKNLF